MIWYNEIIVAAFTAWFLAQLIKVVTVIVTHKKVNFRRFVETGGMPSSHSSTVVALTTVIGRIEGVNSTNFAIALIFALIVMYDAAGVRRAAGKQATALNRLIEEFYKEKPRVDERLKELLGHSPKEVFVGAALGLIIGMLI